jgi:hypothetical protein
MLIRLNLTLVKAIERILIEEWDPLGVRGDAENAHRYETYPRRLDAGLASGWSADQVAAYLAQVETDEMKMPIPESADLLLIAEHILREWRKQGGTLLGLD